MAIEVREALRPSHLLAVTATSLPAVAVQLASLDAVASGQYALVKIDGPPGADAIRLDLLALSNGADGDTYTERVYVVRHIDGAGVLANGYLLEPVADLAWTAGTQTASGDGLDDTSRWAKTVEISNAGRLQARTGVEIAATPAAQSPAGVTIYDAGPAVAVLRVMAAGAQATKVRGLHTRWA